MIVALRTMFFILIVYSNSSLRGCYLKKQPLLKSKKMKNKLLVYIFVFLNCLLSYTQNNISLPEINVPFQVIDACYYSIYVTKDNVVLFENDTIKIHQIKEKLYEGNEKCGYDVSTTTAQSQVHLFIDKEAKYTIVDSIKTEIGSTNSLKHVIYRSNFKQNNFYDIKGIKYKIPKAFYTFLPPKYIYSKKEKIELRERDSLNKIEIMNDPFLSRLPDMSKLNDYDWDSNTVEDAIYSIQQNIIDEQLSGKIFTCILLTNDGFYINDEKYINSINKSQIEKLLINNDILFLNFDNDLIFDNYINLIKTINVLKLEFVHNNKYADIIEMSSQINSIHNKVKIKICK